VGGTTTIFKEEEMSLRIQSNVEAFDAHRNLVNTSNKLASSMQKLSSGYRINRAADDAAGLAISEKLTSQIGGLDQAQRNAQDAVSLVQTAEGAMSEVTSMLQRVRDLAVEFNNGTLSSSDQAAITAEVAQLCTEISRIGASTTFNGIALLTGGASITFQVGANDGETINVNAAQLFGSGSTYKIDSAIFSFSGTVTLASIDTAIQNVSDARANFGAVQNRLEHTLNNLSNYQENLTASESSIKDVDMASEMVNFTKLQVLQQAGTAMLAQANQQPQSILSLLR
jgi:flagellin